jgi:uncharacterized protein
MKRVLAIDGGGIRGLIPAIVCKRIEDVSKRPLSTIFDLIAGTSTGGIIALGIADGLDTSSLVKLYEEQGQTIFANPKNKFHSYLSPKYKSHGLKDILKEKFQNRRLSDVSVNVMVTVYDLSNRKPSIFKSWEVEAGSKDDCLLLEAALATSAAPTFFEPVLLNGNSAVDGGIYCNNPALLAYIEAKKKWPDEEICLLSLGTGTLTTSLLHKEAKTWGKLGWALPALECVFDGVSKTTDNTLIELAKIYPSKFRYWRIQCGLDSTCEEMDNVSEEAIINLSRLGDKLVKDNEAILSEICALKQQQLQDTNLNISNSLDEGSKYQRYRTADIVLDDLKNSGMNVDILKIQAGFTINDLIRICENLYKENLPCETIREKVFYARSHAFTVKYSEPKEDEKLIIPKDINIQNLQHWTHYLFEILKENSILLDDLQVLDVGAGNGHANVDLYKSIRNLRLVDVSAKSLAFAKEKIPCADIIEASAEDLNQIMNDSIDIYFSFRTYQSTLFDIRAALHEAYRVLTRKGVLIISIPIMFPKKDGSIAKGLLRPGGKEPDMEYALKVAHGVADMATCLQFKNVRVDDRSPFELFIIGEL